MHYLTLITAKIPTLIEDEQTNNFIADLISKLEKEKEQSSQSPLCLQNIFLEEYRNMRDTFSRDVNSSVENILEPYYSGTDNPDYLEFWDKTQELESAYEQTVDCFQLPEGRIVPYYHSGACNFIIRNGLVYKRHAGTLQHEKEPNLPNVSRRFQIIQSKSFIRHFPTMQLNTGDFLIIQNKKLMVFIIIRMLFMTGIPLVGAGLISFL